MKIAILSFLIVGTFTLQTSCSTKKNATDEKVTTTQTPDETSNSSTNNGETSETESKSTTIKVSKSDSLFASFEKGYCFGKCPVYKLQIYQSGYSVYEGKANTELTGFYSCKFSKEQMNSLVDIAENIGYMKYDDAYENPQIMDLPSYESSIVIDGRRKVVKRKSNKYPTALRTFERQFDTIISQVKTWTPLNR